MDNNYYFVGCFLGTLYIYILFGLFIKWGYSHFIDLGIKTKILLVSFLLFLAIGRDVNQNWLVQ